MKAVDKQLFDACKNNNLDRAGDAINAGADINVYLSDDTAELPLTYALKKNHHDLVKLLIDNGADVNAWTVIGVNGEVSLGSRLINIAAAYSSYEIINLLLDNGAYVDQHSRNLGFFHPKPMDGGIDAESRPTVYLAMRFGNPRALEALLEHGATLPTKLFKVYSARPHEEINPDVPGIVENEIRFRSTPYGFMQRNYMWLCSFANELYRHLKGDFASNTSPSAFDFRNNRSSCYEVQYTAMALYAIAAIGSSLAIYKAGAADKLVEAASNYLG